METKAPSVKACTQQNLARDAQASFRDLINLIERIYFKGATCGCHCSPGRLFHIRGCIQGRRDALLLDGENGGCQCSKCGKGYLATQHASLWGNPFEEWNPKPKLSSAQCDNPKIAPPLRVFGQRSQLLDAALSLDIFFLWKLACIKDIKNTFVARSGDSAVLPLTQEAEAGRLQVQIHLGSEFMSSLGKLIEILSPKS